MQVNQYNLRYTSDRIGRLVKEAAHVYDMGDALIDTPEKVARLLERVFNASELIAEMKWLMERMDGRLRMRIRVIIWKQWKVPKKRYESLRKLGIPHRGARIAYSGKGYQVLCKSPTIHTALTNKRLKSRGLVSLSSHYAKVHLDTAH
jgi:hypothetical protein